MSKGVAIVSGGMDSVTLAHHLAAEGHELHLVSFDYGQRHGRRELTCAAVCAQELDARHDVIRLDSLTDLIATSALTGDVPVPDGHYAEATMRTTVVPNRNLVMLSIAAAIAVAEEAQWVATGVHGGDHFIYPDCRPEFIDAARAAIVLGNVGFVTGNFQGVIAPFVFHDKTWIASRGDELGVDWRLTWSCYRGGERHCGRCGTCVERREAFHLAGVDDPTSYDDPEFWRAAVAAAAGGS